MIHDVDEAIRTLLQRDALGGASGIEISFEAPTRDWASRQNSPVVDAYLYDIRENLNRREVAYEEIRDETGRVTARRPPPRHFKLSYLLTAWTQRPEDEHRLLSSVLGCFLRHDRIPPEILTGILADQPLSVTVSIALPPSQDRAISDIWSALGGELKPSLDLVINAPFDTGRVELPGPPVLEPIVGVSGPLAAPAPVPAPDGPRPKGKRRGKAEAEPAATDAATSDPSPTAEPPLEVPGERVYGGTEMQPGRTVVAHRIERDGEIR